MFDKLGGQSASHEENQLVRELQASVTKNVTHNRAHTRIAVTGQMAVSAGSRADKRPPGRGSIVDVSRGGCMGILDQPLMVGDAYRVGLEADGGGKQSAFGRCLRVRQVREGVFETAFAFFQLPDLDALSSAA
jgi:hypothetical protein